MTEERIENLETKLSFQEELIQSLDEALGNQQQQILDLRVQLKFVHDQLKDFQAAGPSEGAEPPPPHY